MTGQLVNRLDSILGFIEESAKSGVAFAKEQAPEIIQQLIAWKITENIALIIIVSVIAFLFFRYARIFWKNVDDDPGWIVGVIFFNMFGFISTALVISGILELLQLVVAPKIFLLEYAHSLIK